MDLHGFDYKTTIPELRIPLLPPDSEPVLDLNAIVHTLYERAGYDLVIDSTRPPVPALDPEDQTWAESVIARAKTEHSHARAEGEDSP